MNVPAPMKTLTNLPMMNSEVFEQMQRVGRMLAMSPLFPEHLRKGNQEQAIANGVLVLNMAMRLNEDPLTVGQNIYFVSGKPSFSTSYLIAKANQHGVFKDPIDWEIKGEGDNLSVTAFADIANTGKRVYFTCDMEMARAENWVKNPKYRTMPELMLRYRSAAALIRLYVPDIMVGVPAQIEVELGGELRDITPPASKQNSAPAEENQETKPAKPEKEIVEAETVAESEEPTGGEAETPDYQALSNTILADLEEAPSADAVRGFYADQLNEIKDKAPDIHAELERVFAAKEAA